VVFGVSSIACGQANNGTFTLTGIPSQYNGKYALLVSEDIDMVLLGCITFNAETEEFTLPLISNGRVSIPMWILNESTNFVSRYSGNHTVELEIEIRNSADGAGDIVMICFEEVVFTNGNATKSWKEGEVDD
jgi:hypothetical protein